MKVVGKKKIRKSDKVWKKKEYIYIYPVVKDKYAQYQNTWGEILTTYLDQEKVIQKYAH